MADNWVVPCQVTRSKVREALTFTCPSGHTRTVNYNRLWGWPEPMAQKFVAMLLFEAKRRGVIAWPCEECYSQQTGADLVLQGYPGEFPLFAVGEHGQRRWVRGRDGVRFKFDKSYIDVEKHDELGGEVLRISAAGTSLHVYPAASNVIAVVPER